MPMFTASTSTNTPNLKDQSPLRWPTFSILPLLSLGQACFLFSPGLARGTGPLRLRSLSYSRFPVRRPPSLECRFGDGLCGMLSSCRLGIILLLLLWHVHVQRTYERNKKMNNADFRRMALGADQSRAAGTTVIDSPIAGNASSLLSWPELVGYDGRMVARAIHHDRPDVRVITLTEEQSVAGEHAELIAQQNENWDGWEDRAAPLTDEDRAANELVVFLVVRPCSGARAQDTTVVQPPWVMRTSVVATGA